jgi:surface antigen
MNSFKGTPIAQLAADEKKAFHTALVQVLNQVPDRSSVDWKAPRTKLATRITPVKSFDVGQLRCRETLIEANAQNGQHHGTHVFCRNVKGEWHFRKPVAKAGAKK